MIVCVVSVSVGACMPWRTHGGVRGRLSGVCLFFWESNMIRLTEKACLPTEQSSPIIFITLNDYFEEWKYSHSSNQQGMSTCPSIHPCTHPFLYLFTMYPSTYTSTYTYACIWLRFRNMYRVEGFGMDKRTLGVKCLTVQFLL